MISALIIKVNQFIERLKSDGVKGVIKETIFLNRKAVTFEKDLSDFKADVKLTKDSNIEIKKISNSNSKIEYKFPNKSRYLKTLNNIKKGYETFVLIRNEEIIGDCWFATSLEADKKMLHHDLDLFGIKPVQKSAYMFDMYVKPEERGTEVTNSILKYAYNDFSKRGITKVYTYVMADNTPAIWMVRMLGFKELKKLSMQRFLFLRKVQK